MMLWSRRLSVAVATFILYEFMFVILWVLMRDYRLAAIGALGVIIYATVRTLLDLRSQSRWC
jgi:hypothetical protein